MRYFLISISVLIAFFIGCSGSSPVHPVEYPDQQLTALSDLSGTGNMLLGIFNIVIDPDSMTAEITPLRTADFNLNIIKFLQPPATPIQLLTVEFDLGASDPPNGFFALNLEITHPFPGLHQYRIFDVRGIFLSNGNDVGEYDSTVIMAGENESQLVNADGYTRFWNWVEFTNYEMILGACQSNMAPPIHCSSTVNGYKYFAEGLEAEGLIEDLDPEMRGIFNTTGIKERRYEIQFKMEGGNPIFDFNLAIDAAWDEPDNDYEPEYPVESFPLTSNCAEAYHMIATDAGSDAYYVDETTNGGSFIFDMEIFDHQGAVNPDGVPGEIHAIRLEGDSLAVPVNVLPTATAMPGNGYDSSTFHVELANLDLTQSGESEFFCTVESENPDSFMPQIPNGQLFDYPAGIRLAAYFKFTLPVSDESPIVPEVYTIDPESGAVDTTLVDVEITGANFTADCTVELEFEPGDTIDGTNIEFIDVNTLQTDLDLTAATLGLYDVIVTDPSTGSGILEDGFEVVEDMNDPAIIDTLCPMWGFPDEYVDAIHLEGADIMDGATVEIEDEFGGIIEAQNVIFIDENNLEFDLDLTDAVIGYYTVRVKNPNAPAGEQENGFEVMDPDNLPTWPTIQGNSQNTGMVGLYGPCDVHEAPTWDLNWQPNPYGNPLPIYLTEDTCFISNTGDGGPLPCGAIDFTSQSVLWNQQFHDDMQNWLNLKCITEDGSVALTYESKYFRLVGLDGTDGSFLWQVAGIELRCDTLPTLDLDGNFIVPIKDVGYYSINPADGAINWNSNTGDMYYSQPAIGENGRIYAYDGSQNNGCLMALDPSDGSVIWESESLGNCRANGVTVHPNGTIILPRVAGLTCFQDNDTSVEILWTEPYSCPFYSSVAIAPDDTIIFVSWEDAILHRIDPVSGAELDFANLPPGDTPSNRPAISKDGHIYLRTRNYMGNLTFFECYDKDLTLKWQWYHGNWIGGSGMLCAPAIGQDGTLYSSSRPYGLIAWKDD